VKTLQTGRRSGRRIRLEILSRKQRRNFGMTGLMDGLLVGRDGKKSNDQINESTLN
jgi:hypothetical protein